MTTQEKKKDNILDHLLNTCNHKSIHSFLYYKKK